jgi:hypothetical protein
MTETQKVKFSPEVEAQMEELAREFVGAEELPEIEPIEPKEKVITEITNDVMKSEEFKARLKEKIDVLKGNKPKSQIKVEQKPQQKQEDAPPKKEPDVEAPIDIPMLKEARKLCRTCMVRKDCTYIREDEYCDEALAWGQKQFDALKRSRMIQKQGETFDTSLVRPPQTNVGQNPQAVKQSGMAKLTSGWTGIFLAVILSIGISYVFFSTLFVTKVNNQKNIGALQTQQTNLQTNVKALQQQIIDLQTQISAIKK